MYENGVPFFFIGCLSGKQFMREYINFNIILLCMHSTA